MLKNKIYYPFKGISGLGSGLTFDMGTDKKRGQALVLHLPPSLEAKKYRNNGFTDAGIQGQALHYTLITA